jgi:hypothetical protein
LKPGKPVQYEERFGVPTFVWAASSSAEEKLARGQRARDVVEEARRHLSQYASIYDLSAEDVATAKVDSVHDTGRGAIIVKFREEIRGVEIFREELSVAMDRSLERIALSGYLSGASRSAAQGGGAFRLDVRSAIAAALHDRTGAEISPADLVAGGRRQGPYEFVEAGPRLQQAANDKLVEPARIKPVYFHLPDRFEPAYYLELTVESTDAEGNVDNDLYSYVISAANGEILYRNNLTVSDSFSYRVWADTSGGSADYPMDSPHGTNFTPHPTGNSDMSVPPYISSSVHTLQAYPFSHSATDPWLPAAATETVGNNVDAYVDRAGADGFTPPGDFRANISSALTFDYSFDPTVDPLANSTQQKAAITSLFYIDNFLHDWFYDAGFDEAAHVAQTDNYGRGGPGAIAGDSIRAEAQDGSGTNNANMSTGADGNRPRQQMYLWSGPQNETITVNSQPGGSLPASYNPFQIGTAAFGPQAFEVTADVVRAIPNDACSPLTNAAAVAGKIAFVDRGGACAAGFSTKDSNAAAAGAVGVIIANVSSSAFPGTAPNMGATNPPCPAQPSASFGSCTIPALSLNFSDGEAWRSALALGAVNARMKRDPVIQRDGSLDAHVVAHEWGHYLSNRNISNGAGLGTNQSRGMGEGWSDFVSLLTTVREGDDLVSANTNWSGIYPLVPYAAVAFSTDPYYFGIRRLPYSTDMTKDPLTFKHISNGTPIVFGGPCNGCSDSSNQAEVHNTGEIWATMLWEGFASLLNAHPFDDARLRMRDYLVASLKLTPANPTFVEARDAVLAAAYAADPADHALFCAAFAKRGIGQRAIAPDRFSTTNAGVTESFTCDDSLSFVSATLAAPTSACDADSYLDNFETAPLTIVLKNEGLGPLSDTSAVVSSTNPKVSLANGGNVTFPATNPEQTTSAVIEVSMAGATGIQEFTIDIAFQDSGISFPQPVTGSVQIRGNADEVANSTATDTVEPIQTSWSPGGGPGSWQRETLSTFNHAWLGPNANVPSDITLTSPTLNVNGSLGVSFKHRFNFESTFDGGVIEISVNGGAFTDIGNALAGYNGTIAATDNVLTGRRAYTGNSTSYPTFQTKSINFGAAYVGQNVRLRFRIGTDTGTGAVGWEIDDIAASGISNTPFYTLTGQAAASTVTTVAAKSSQYSDQVTLSATVTSCNNTPTGSVQFQIDRGDGAGYVNVGGAAALSAGTATQSYTVGEKPGTYSIKAIYTPDNAFVSGSFGTNTLTVSREDAAITPASGNPSTVQVASPGGTATLTLSAAVAEVQNGSGQVSGTTESPGDICKSQSPTPPTIVMTPVGPGAVISHSGTVSCSGGVFTFSWTFAGVPVNVYDVTFDLHSDWYAAPTASWVVAVYDPSLGFTTGGGTILHNGYKANFGFSVKYQRNGGAQGSFLYTEHRPTGDLKVKSNNMKSLSVVGSQAIILTKNAIVNGVGNYSVRAVGIDNGPGPSDQFGMTLYDTSNSAVAGEDFSSSPETLTGGNVIVPQNSQ